MDNEIKNTHGGKREGAGRPKGIKKPIKSEEDRAKQHQIRMTDHEWEIFQKNGGIKNLKRLIHLGKFRKII